MFQTTASSALSEPSQSRAIEFAGSRVLSSRPPAMRRGWQGIGKRSCRGIEAPAPRYRPSPLRLGEPELEDAEAAAGREEANEEAAEPPRGPQNEIVMPILDMIFAEADSSPSVATVKFFDSRACRERQECGRI
jgi:hypothetical protein